MTKSLLYSYTTPKKPVPVKHLQPWLVKVKEVELVVDAVATLSLPTCHMSMLFRADAVETDFRRLFL